MLDHIDLSNMVGHIKDARDGLPKMVAKTRICLKCGNPFFSDGPQVRKCSECKRRESYEHNEA